MTTDVESIFQELRNQSMSSAALTEANDRTIPSGTYKIEIVKKTEELAGDTSPWPGRPMIRVSADAHMKNGSGEYHRRGRIQFDLSPQESRVERTKKLDSQSRLFANLSAVVGKKATIGEAMDYLGQYPLTATVSRTFKTLDGRWVTPKTDEESQKLMDEGAEPRNFVQSLRAFNG